MKVLVVYDSAYGNTEQIAKSIGSAIEGDVKVVNASKVIPSELASLDLLIVGAPTQGFRPTKPVQTFIKDIPKTTLKGVSVAAFDTRIAASDVGKGLRLLIKMGGYAAPHIASALNKKGGNLIAPPEGFFVKDKEGPMKEGEQARAAAWAKEITK
ncbi:flavodoxin family protein [Chloroflexota bacterium]